MLAVNPEAELIESMGSDLSVVNAARASFGKRKDILDESDARLLKYLARNQHWSPFYHPHLTIWFKEPIFVARQLFRSQVGLSISELSRRYIDREPEFYFPESWRERAENTKQGSGKSLEDVKLQERIGVLYLDRIIESFQSYNALLDYGVAPEMARIILPQSMMTEWYWTGSLYAFFRVWSLRHDQHAQWEIQQTAARIRNLVVSIFPLSWEALEGAIT